MPSSHKSNAHTESGVFIHLLSDDVRGSDCMASTGRMTSERAGKDMEENCLRLLDVLSLHEHHD